MVEPSVREFFSFHLWRNFEEAGDIESEWTMFSIVGMAVRSIVLYLILSNKKLQIVD